MQYTDRNAKESKLEVGDTVVLKNEQRSKLDPNFKPERYKVTGLTGSDMTCENDEGKIMRRNVTWAKKIESAVEKSSVGDSQPTEAEIPRTSGRERRMPERYNDFQLYLHGSPEGSIGYS